MTSTSTNTNRSPGRPPATSRLSDRDLRALAWMGEQYAARMDHLQALMGTGMNNVRRIVARMRAAGFVRSERILVDVPTWVTPTAAGLAACGLPYGLWTPILSQLTHVGAMNDVRLHIQAQRPEIEWISERQLRLEAGKRMSRNKHVPDGVAILEGHSMAIEVELTIKPAHKVEAILDEFAGRFDATLYYCAPQPYRQLRRLEQSGRWRALGVRELPRKVKWQ
jgi:hypothetical protein